MNNNDDDSYNPATKTVNWDPHSALRTTAGGLQSPALGLGHEMGHAKGPNWWHKLLGKIHSRNYDNLEERRVIRGLETSAAKALGEGVRTDHHGTTYPASGPTSCH